MPRFVAQPLVPASAKMIGSMEPSVQTTLTVVLKNPDVQHKVQVQNFDGWNGEAGTYETLYNAL